MNNATACRAGEYHLAALLRPQRSWRHLRQMPLGCLGKGGGCDGSFSPETEGLLRLELRDRDVLQRRAQRRDLPRVHQGRVRGEAKGGSEGGSKGGSKSGFFPS